MGLIFKLKDITIDHLRSNRNVCLNHCRTKRYGLDSLSYHGAHLWNLLPNDMKKCKDLDIFKAYVLGTGMNLCVNVVCVCNECFLYCGDRLFLSDQLQCSTCIDRSYVLQNTHLLCIAMFSLFEIHIIYACTGCTTSSS